MFVSENNFLLFELQIEVVDDDPANHQRHLFILRQGLQKAQREPDNIVTLVIFKFVQKDDAFWSSFWVLDGFSSK